ncbi:MAG: type II toxin-antitoxin system VapC family toxin [Candidatus Eremiobacteraeota bacterium]|nr:type II toxin-antitoxin system VapC family toxin [Candidatus Eremiobacteraeota bacterium]
MIVDSSAIVAVVFQEPDYAKVAHALDRSEVAAIGAPTVTETGIVLGHRLGFRRLGLLHRFLQEFDISIVPFEEAHWTEAVAAYEAFGRGRHPAALNFGDCLSYALAKVAGRPLLCVGNDFAKTDLELVPV